MKLSDAIDLYIADMRAEGRINSDTTERAYRHCLALHADDAGNRDPRYTGREHVKKTLARWSNPNTRGTRRASLVSFYDWAMQELDPPRKDNPARQTRPPRRRKPKVYRLTQAETIGLLGACRGSRERRAIFLGVCAGARSAELRGFQRRHFERPGWIWISSDIAKGGRERWVPVLPELQPIVNEILQSLGPTTRDHRGKWVGDYVLCAERWRDPGRNTERGELSLRPASAQALYYLVKRVAKRAGIVADIGPHTMRHAFGDHVARYAGMRNAQFLLGHADIGTTETYTGEPTLDELATSIRGMSFLNGDRTTVLGGPGTGSIPLEAPTGIEPVASSVRAVEPNLAAWLERHASAAVRLHRARFEAMGEVV